jgi:hypothetical protein
MFLAASNKSKQLLYLSFIGRIGPEDLQRGFEDLELLLADLQAGFRVLADFSRLEFMDLACATEIGRAMELVDQRGVGLVARVIPDPSKDIGMNILTVFHYARRPRIVSCSNMVEAAKALSL